MACHFIALLMANNALQGQGVSLDQTVLNKFSVYIPEAVKFKQSKAALACRRSPLKLRAENTTYATNNNKQIKIKFPNSALLDTRYGHLTFDCAIAVTGGTYRRLAYGAYTPFQRLNLKVATADVEDIRDYNRAQAIILETEVIADIMSSFGSSTTVGGLGFGTTAERNALGLLNTSYAIPLFSGVLNTELLPFQNVKSGMELSLYLDDPTTFVETDGTTPIVTISNVVFHVEKLDLDEKYLSFIMNYVAANGLQMGFHSLERYSNALSTGLQQTILLNARQSSVSGFFNVFVDSTTINTTTTNDKFLNWLPQNLTQYQMTSNGVIFPDEPIDCTTNGGFEAYKIYARYLCKWKLNGMIPEKLPIPFDFFRTNRFIFMLDMEAYPEENGLINPFTTLNNSASTQLKLTFSAPVAANTQLDTWVKYFKQVTIYGDGSARVIQ